MPLFHCDNCHHEFESYSVEKGVKVKAPKCDWCGAGSHMIEEKTPMERMCDEIEKMGVDKFFSRLGMIEEEIGREIL
jgi:transcription elongation factor Elf1